MNRDIWSTLGLAPTNDTVEIKRAYARRLKETHPEDDPEGFQALRAAYDRAAQMARDGWAVPRPYKAEEDALEEDNEAPFEPGAAFEVRFSGGAEDRWRPSEAGQDPTGWAPGPEDRWRRSDPAGDETGWAPAADDRWNPASAAAEAEPTPDLGEDVRAELARERQLADAHQALCDQLAAIVSDPAGDRHAALAAMIRIFRSPAMDSISIHARTEYWLAHVVAVGGPVVDDMVEPLIHFFGWDARRVGVDLRHAEPVLERREAGIALRRLERKMDPDHEAWQALKRRPQGLGRLRERLMPGFPRRVEALLRLIEERRPELAGHMDPAAVAYWRERERRPVLGPIFLIALLLAPPFLALIGVASLEFGAPGWTTFAALWTVFGSALLALGLAHLHAVARPRRAWLVQDPWGRPLWLRFGWAPAALTLPLAAGAVPAAFQGWVAAAAILVAAGLWGWTRVVIAHLGDRRQPFDWGRYVSLIPVTAFLLLEIDRVGPAVLFAYAGAATVLQAGSDAIADEFAYLEPNRRRLWFAGLLGVVLAGAAALLGAAFSGLGLTLAAGLVAAVALADRALAWGRVDGVAVMRRFLLLGGWFGGMIAAAVLPLPGTDRDLYVGLGLWLLAAALATAASGLLEGLPRLGGGKRKPGALA